MNSCLKLFIIIIAHFGCTKCIITKEILHQLKETELDFQEKYVLSFDTFIQNDETLPAIGALVENYDFYISTINMDGTSCLNNSDFYYPNQDILRLINYEKLKSYAIKKGDTEMSYIKECHNLMTISMTPNEVIDFTEKFTILNHPYVFALEIQKDRSSNIYELQMYSNRTYQLSTMNGSVLKQHHGNPYHRRIELSGVPIRLSNLLRSMNVSSDYDPSREKSNYLINAVQEALNFSIIWKEWKDFGSGKLKSDEARRKAQDFRIPKKSYTCLL